MAIIYTYPTKTTLALADKVLISDSADSNKTKNATITSIKDAIDVVDTLSNAFGTYITGTANTAAKGAVDIGTVDLSAVDGTAETTTRFLSKDNTWDLPLVYSGGANIGYVPTGGIAGRYLDGAGTWSTIDLTTDVNGILAVENGGTGGGVYTAGDLIYYAGPAFTRLATSGVTDGFVLTAASGVPSWATPPDTTIDTKNAAVSVANPTISLDFGTALTAISGGGGAAAISFTGGLNDLSNVSYAGANDSSMYIGNGVPSGLIGTPTKTTALGEGAGNGTTSGSSNTLVGTNAGIGVTTGSTNTLIGADSGDTLTIGAGNVILGSGADSNANNVNAAIAIGKDTVASTGSVAIGESASATGSGIALGRGATNTVANLALGSASYPLLNTSDLGNVNGLGTGQNPALFIEVQIGATKYYMALYEQA